MQGFPRGAGAADLAQLQSTMQAIEHACSEIQMFMNPTAAEATLLAFRQLPHPYQSCKFILENSQMANARFQAAGAIRDAALREWGFISDDEKKELIIYCLRYVMEHSTATDAYVQVKVSSVAAQLLKRGWMEFSATEKEAFFIEVKHAILGNHGLDVQFSGLNFLESLVSEFSTATSSAMGLPTEFHQHCSSLLEAEYLKNFYRWAQDAVLSVADRIIEDVTSASEDKVCSAALRLMLQILNWDFKNTNNRGKRDCALLKNFDRTLVQPGQTWCDVLVSNGHIVWLLGFYKTLREKFSNDVLWFDSPLAVSARGLIVQFCSLAGTVFPSDNGQTQERCLGQILSFVIQWIDSPDIILSAIRKGQSESELIDGCHCLLSMATVTSTTVFNNLLKSVSRPFGTLKLISALTCEVVKAFTASSEKEEWLEDATDILLETWNVFLGREDSNKETLSSEGSTACADLFKVLLESHLKVAADSAFDDDGDGNFNASISKRDERLSSYALIARAAADFSLPLLVRQFSERISILFQGKGTIDPTQTLEELYWLLLMSGHILTEPGQGETVLVPKALLIHFLDVRDASHHPVLVLSWSVINFAEQSLNPELRATFFSPRLMEALIWFLARWADTYLMPSESVEKHFTKYSLEWSNIEHLRSNFSSKALLSFAGENNHGKPLLDTLVRISISTLVSYPGETLLQGLICHQLLPALVRRKNVSVHLVTLDSWHTLANAFANEKTLFSVTARLQRSLAETLVRSASSIEEFSSSDRYVRDLMGPMTTYLIGVSTKTNIKTVALQPDVIHLVICLIERLRGAVRATEPRTQKSIFEMAVAVMNPLLTLMDIYRDETTVIYMILKFAVDLVDGQVVFLNAEDTTMLVGFCMRLLQIYSSHNIRKISLSLSPGLMTEAKTEKYKDLRALLQLLTNLCSKDLVDFSSTSEEEDSPDIAQVVYLGLHIAMPLMSLELLKYPKLCHAYFSLLSHMLEVHPEKVAQLNVDAFEHIVRTLDWGIRQEDIEVVDMCFGAIYALASYHYKEKTLGRQGLGTHKMVFQESSEALSEDIISHFLKALMWMLLFDDFSTDLLGSAADALLPLLLCEQDLYQQLVDELTERQPNDILKSRVDTAFKSLTRSNQLSLSLDRSNRQRFRKNLHKFFIDVSGVLRTK